MKCVRKNFRYHHDVLLVLDVLLLKDLKSESCAHKTQTEGQVTSIAYKLSAADFSPLLTSHALFCTESLCKGGSLEDW